MHSVWLVNLETVPYADALAMQHQVVAARKRGELNDVLFLLEHPPVFTLGRNAKDSNILAAPDLLKGQGIEVFRVERVGDVTYHGPGQLVGYPILDLKQMRQDVGWFVRSMEEVLVRVLADFGIRGRLVEKLIGVWVDNPDPAAAIHSPDAKIVQIGARIENWITYHGFALNVDPNMRHFDLIVPCGISDKAVTSMARMLKAPIAMDQVRRCTAAHFAEVFGVEMVLVPREEFAKRVEKANAEG